MQKTSLLCLTTLLTTVYAQDFPSVQTQQKIENELNFQTSLSDQFDGTFTDNAWEFFIAPLQNAHLKQLSSGGTYVPLSTPAVQNALQALYALRCMQSQVGGIYDAYKKLLSNQDDQPANPYEVSVKSNASSLAGLMIFQQILQDELAYEFDLSFEQKQQIQTALNDIAAMVHGGTTPQGTQTKGLLSFFKNCAWDDETGIFYQGGDANNPKLASDWVPTKAPKAVDVNTWTVSVLGQRLIDTWFGFGTCYELWQKVKNWSGFFGPDKEIWGVGYSDEDGNGSEESYAQGIISTESTAGAINMVRCLITQYKDTHAAICLPCQIAHANLYVQGLEMDEDSMLKKLMTLRSDLYPATAWAIMLHYNFNPFKIGGDYTAST